MSEIDPHRSKTHFGALSRRSVFDEAFSWQQRENQLEPEI